MQVIPPQFLCATGALCRWPAVWLVLVRRSGLQSSIGVDHLEFPTAVSPQWWLCRIIAQLRVDLRSSCTGGLEPQRSHQANLFATQRPTYQRARSAFSAYVQRPTWSTLSAPIVGKAASMSLSIAGIQASWRRTLTRSMECT